MTTPPATTPAGWYPAPDGSGVMWWWDGARWVQPQSGGLPQPMQLAPHSASPNPGAVAKLAVVTQILLIASGAVAALALALEIFGVGIASDFIDGGGTPFSLFDFYDQAGIALSVVSVLVAIATGVLWVVWQFHAAKHAIGQTRRSPGWHAGSWFIPVVSLWFPYQNISDLWRAFGRVRPSWLILWWLLWLASAFVMQISARVSLAAEDLETLRVAMALGIVAELLTLAAVPFACLVVRGITQLIIQRAAGTSPASFA